MREIFLKDLAEISVGVSISRMRDKSLNNGNIEKYITPKSINKNSINDREIENIFVGDEVNKIKRTKIDDILIKTTTPFDSVLIDEDHQGLIYNSFCINLTLKLDLVDSKYIYAILNTSYIRSKLEKKVKSYKTTPISKRDIEEIKIPYVGIEKQKLIGELYLNTINKEKNYEKLIKTEKDMIEEIIFEKGDF